MKSLLVHILLVYSQYAGVFSEDPVAPAPGDEDAARLEFYKKEVCSLVPEFKGEPEENTPEWSDVMTNAELLELAFLNTAYGLTSDAVTHLKDKLKWKKTVIDLISLVTKTTCEDHVISERYLNAAKNFFLHYLTKYERSVILHKPKVEDSEADAANATAAEQRAKDWEEVIKALQTCAAEMSPIEFTVACKEATSFVDSDGSSLPIVLSHERFDDEILEGLFPDVVIETVWWMFSTTYARCYAHFYPNEDIILLFYELFREDFLEQFNQRWRNVGPVIEHMDIAFGPFESSDAASNVRRCATAAYQFQGFPERQLVRPILVLQDNMLIRNYKV